MTHASAGPAFEARNLVKSYAKGKRVLDGLSLSVPRGRVLGLVGRNGSGKTTLLRCAVGLLRTDAGEVHTFGANFRDATPEIKARTVYVSQQCASPGGSDLRTVARINALLYPKHDDALLGRLVNRFGIPADAPLATLSLGQRQMALIALAFATRPELVLLDEPAAGLDPISCRHLLSTIAEAVSELDGVTMLMSTHRLQDIERVADSVAVIADGKIRAHENIEELRAETRRWQLVFADGVPENFAVPGALRVMRDGPVLNALVRVKSDATLHALRESPGLTVMEHPVSLEDLFVEYYANPAE